MVVVVLDIFHEDGICLLKLYEVNNLLPVLLKLRSCLRIRSRSMQAIAVGLLNTVVSMFGLVCSVGHQNRPGSQASRYFILGIKFFSLIY